MDRSLPEENLKKFFKDKDVAETYLMNQITFCEEMFQVHFGIGANGESTFLKLPRSIKILLH